MATNRASPPTRRVLFRAAVVVLGLGLDASAGLRGLERAAVGFPDHPTTVEEVRAELREATPIGSTKDRVMAWVESRGLAGDCSVFSGDDLGRSTWPISSGSPEGRNRDEVGGAVFAMIRDTYRSLICRGQVGVEWYFDRSGKLIDCRIRDADQCL